MGKSGWPAVRTWAAFSGSVCLIAASTSFARPPRYVQRLLSQGGSFRTLKPTSHTTTNIEVIRKFLDAEIAVTTDDNDSVMVEVAGAKG